MQLVACSGCNRHIRVSATRCPFCGDAASRTVSRLIDLGGKLSRAAVFAGAAACYTSSPSTTHVTNPPPPPPDDTPVETTSTATFAQPPPGDGQPAQGTGSIEGVARNGDTGAAIPNTGVTVLTKAGPLRVTTDAHGKFAIKDLPPGGYQLQFESYNGNPRQAPPSAYAEVKPGEVAHVVLQTYPYVPDRGPCCKPYGAPPARRRVV
ncbi:MAG TPA: carboxypeptidase regulatory-like domain-containing protein [Kofleriaceae bacterium]|jgi:hypothetical protein|nr:carboxypeptidase regulatory-like domain-containing protein [Kofleriaceae bacterium]